MQATHTCSVNGCDRPSRTRGWCPTHYARWRKYGSVELPPRLSPYERFMSYVDTSGGLDACHPWTGRRNRYGYGWFKVNGRGIGSPRWLLGYLRGKPLDPDEWALHRCDNPPCCNERHLYVGDHVQNMRDRTERGRAWNPVARANSLKTHCPKGHPYDEANTYRTREGYRYCKTCNVANVRAYAARRRAPKILKS